MIYFYKHRTMDDLTPKELDLMGYEGVLNYALYHGGFYADALFRQIKILEQEIEMIKDQQFDIFSQENHELASMWIDRYIDYFNKNAAYEKQAYVVIGNIACGKSTYSKRLEQETNSIIVDADNFKMGAETPHGFFEGLTSLYRQPTDRERMQDACSDAGKAVLKNVSDLGMNLILPKAPTSLEKLEKNLKCLTDKNYDVHLIWIDAPIEECANRNYFRYLIKEYSANPNEHGRFVPVSVITNIGDGPFETFAKAYGQKRFKSFKAFFNDKYRDNEEIDLKSMYFPQ